MKSNEKLSVDRSLDLFDFQKKLSQVDEKNKMVINNGVHLSFNAIVEINELVIGISHEIGGPYPVVKTFDNGSHYFIGVDCKLYYISFFDKKICWTICFDTPFIDLSVLADGISMIIVEECGVSKWIINQSMLWVVDTDLITDYSIDSEYVVVSDMDDNLTKISIETGKIV